MKDDYVSFELAKKLKEKGYPQGMSFQSYFVGDNICRGCNVGDVVYRNKKEDDTHLIACPTIAQVLKWLREKHKFHIIVGLDMFLKYDWLIQRIDRKEANLTSHFNNNRDTYEQAALAGIEYVLDKLL